MKLLWKSDLSLFATIYKREEAIHREVEARRAAGSGEDEYLHSKQKGINLNKDVVIDDLHPGVPRIPGPRTAVYPVISRKVIYSANNWRLNVELICGPDEEPGLYDYLVPGDVAVLRLTDDPELRTVRSKLPSAMPWWATQPLSSDCSGPGGARVPESP